MQMAKETDASDIISHLRSTFADTGSLWQSHSKGGKISQAVFQFRFQSKKTLAEGAALPESYSDSSTKRNWILSLCQAFMQTASSEGKTIPTNIGSSAITNYGLFCVAVKGRRVGVV